jgi:hypothetical protein
VVLEVVELAMDHPLLMVQERLDKEITAAQALARVVLTAVAAGVVQVELEAI